MEFVGLSRKEQPLFVIKQGCWKGSNHNKERFSDKCHIISSCLKKRFNKLGYKMAAKHSKNDRCKTLQFML